MIGDPRSTTQPVTSTAPRPPVFTRPTGAVLPTPPSKQFARRPLPPTSTPAAGLSPVQAAAGQAGAALRTGNPNTNRTAQVAHRLQQVNSQRQGTSGNAPRPVINWGR